MTVRIQGVPECNVCPWKGDPVAVEMAVWNLLQHKIGDHGCKSEGCTIYCTTHRWPPVGNQGEAKGG